MATIEHCDFLSPVLKAKLQDNGYLYLSELRRALVSAEATPSAEVKVCSHHDAEDSATASRLLHLRAVFAFLSEQELTQLLSSAAVVAAPGASPSTLKEPALASSACVQVRSLGEVLGIDLSSSSTKVASLPPRARVTTFCRALDQLLGGGLPTEAVTELCGPPGVGKTQLLQQLAVSCVLPCEFGGLDGSCLYVDTEGSFSAERLRELMVSAVGLVQSASARAVADADGAPGTKRARVEAVNPSSSSVEGNAAPETATTPSLAPLTALAERFTVDEALERVFYVRCTELSDLVAVLHTVDAYKATRVPDLRMLIVDSIAFPFRTFQDAGHDGNGSPNSPTGGAGSALSLRYRPLLFTCSQLLQKLAASLSLTVVVSNHVTTRSLYLAAPDNETSGNSGSNASFRGEARRGPWSEAAPSPASPTVIPSPRATGVDSGRRLTEASASPQSTSSQANLPQRTTLLVPALGDAWSGGIGTRLMLSFHHYGASTSTAALCREDVVKRTSRTLLDAEGTLRQYENLLQHRVARLLCSPTNPRGECCFAITRKGIRDMPRSAS